MGWLRPKSWETWVLMPNTEVGSLLCHPQLQEVCQDPSLKGCVDLIGKYEKCGP